LSFHALSLLAHVKPFANTASSVPMGIAWGRELKLDAMQIVRRHLRCWVFVAIFALLGVAVLPALAHVAMTAAGVQWVEICSTAGSRWVQIDDRAAPTSGDPSTVMDMTQCPACCHLGQGAGLPPRPLQLALLMFATQAMPVLFLRAPHPLFAWTVAQPREPPALG
jgi:Protein of unknown function (DUF2946)